MTAVAPAPVPELTVVAEAEGPEAPTPVTGPPRPRPVVAALAAVLVACVVVAFVGVFAFVLGGMQEHRAQHQLYDSYRQVLTGFPLAPRIGGQIPAGTPVALLDAPAAGLHDLVVVEGTSSDQLLSGPGHLRDSPLPGQAGDAVVMGRSVTVGAPFAGVPGLRPGDVVTVRTGQGRFRFVVLDVRGPGQRGPTERSDTGLLTLVTSAGRGPLGGLTPDHLVYVDAKLDGRAVAAPHGRPTTVPAAELPGHGDPGGLPYVILWLGLLVAASAGCWWLWARWGLLRTWLVGAPVLLALLWAVADQALRLFPNVY